MATLSLTQAWNETASFAKRERALLLPLALLAVLPGAALQLVVPAAPRGQLPSAGLWMLLVPIGIAVAMTANLAISRLALRPGTSVGEALAHGLRRMPVFLALALMVAIASILLLTILATIALLATGGSGAQPSPRGMTLAILVALPLMLYLAARLLLTTPVAAAETGGPVSILRRSWELTRSHAWKLVGLLVLLAIFALVVVLAVSTVTGILIVLIAGPPQPGSLSGMLILVVATILNTVMTAYLTTFIARIYAQLAGESAKGI